MHARLGLSCALLFAASCRPTARQCPDGESARPSDATPVAAREEPTPIESRWKQPPEEILDVLHAPPLPQVFTSPTGRHLMRSQSWRRTSIASRASSSILRPMDFTTIAA